MTGYRAQRLQRQMSVQRVLLAVYWLADDVGLFCCASKAEIARAAGRGVETVQGCLRELERDGVISSFLMRPGGRKVFVLLDHPNAEEALTEVERAGAIRLGVGVTEMRTTGGEVG